MIARYPRIPFGWLLLVCALVVTHNTVAQTWAASTGTVDPSSLLTYQFANGTAIVRPVVRTGTVTLRYNVLPVGDLAVPITEPCCEGRALWVRFLDNGPDAQVLVALKRYNVTTGVTTTLLTFDSNLFAPQSTFQTAGANTGPGQFFNFSFASGPFNGPNNEGGDSVYYIEAKLIKSAAGGTPGLASVSIVKTLAP